MRKWVRAVLSGTVAIALTVSMLAYLTELVERKNSRQKYEQFKTQQADFDVLFMGTSHVINGVYPMELWEDYGMVSYNFGGHANTLAVTEWTLENALRYTTPRLVVIDGLRLSITTRIYDNVENAHVSFDAFPLNATKVKAALDLTEDKMQRAELIWDFSIYHDRWSQIVMNDFVPGATPEKGAESRIAVAENAVFTPIDRSRVLTDDTVGVAYLRKAIELCQQRGIDVLLTYLPFPASEGEQMEANRIYEIAAEYGVDYINFLDMDLVDFTVDSYDPVSHLNPSGARKVTDYLGKYIREHYDVPDRRQDPAYAGWYEDYEAYTKFKLDNLGAQTDLKNYLMLLQDKHLSACVYLAENELWHSGVYERLLANMGVDSGQLRPEGPTLAVVDNMTGSVVYLGAGEKAETGFGETRFVEKNGAYGVRINGGGVMVLQSNASLGAVVVDNASGAAATSSQFAVTVQPAASSVTKIP